MMFHFYSVIGLKNKQHWVERQITINIFMLNLTICLTQPIPILRFKLKICKL